MKNFVKIYSIAFFILLFLIGLLSYQDYGVTGDEPIHRWIGSIYYNYIKDLILNFNLNNEHFIEINRLINDEYLNIWVAYPIFFELLTEFLIDIFNIESAKVVFELRHLVNFLIFYISLIFFYKLIQEQFRNYFLSFLGILFMFFSPRIFAESFYNHKDILFMSLSIINIFFTLKFLNSQNNKNLILYSISAGILINTRPIMGFIFPLLTFCFILFEVVDDNKILFHKIKKILLSIILIFLVVLLFWPYLWFDTINHLSYYLGYVKNLELVLATNTYFGETILSHNTPWHFSLVWIAITIPTCVLIFSICGFLTILFRFSKRILSLEKLNKLWFSKNERYDYIIFLLLSFPLMASLFYKNNFAGWRHYYYIYPLLVYHFLYFLNEIKIKNSTIYKSLLLLSILNVLINLQWMVKFHPHQYTYFNFISKHFIKKNFNLDNKGESLKHSLKYILEKDKRDSIKVSDFGEISIKGASLILKKNSQNRLKFVNLDDADYIIDVFRPKAGKKILIDQDKFSKYYDLVIDKKVVNSIYKKNK